MSSFSLPLNGNFDNKCWVNLLIGQTECNRLVVVMEIPLLHFL